MIINIFFSLCSFPADNVMSVEKKKNKHLVKSSTKQNKSLINNMFYVNYVHHSDDKKETTQFTAR